MSGTGSAAAVSILLMGLIIGLTLAQPSMDRAAKDIKEARDDTTRQLKDMKNMEISIISAEHNSTTSVLNVTIGNPGADVIDLARMDLMVNGTWTQFDPGTGHLYPGDEYLISLSGIPDPRSVRIVGDMGISDQTTEIM